MNHSISRLSTGRRKPGPALLVLVTMALALIPFAGTARAELTYLGSFGSSGTGAGQFADPAGIAINEATGDVYVADRNQNRIEQFTAAGSFIRAWGYGVVQSGPDNVPHHESQSVAIRGADGTFRLTFGADTSAPIAYNASAEEVEAALNAVPSINAGGGSVTVTGGPGNVTGSNPYVVTFSGGPLGDTNVPALTVDATGIAQPQGTSLTCLGGPAATTESVQWLRSGEPIPGATGTTYVTRAADAGLPVQCQFTAIGANTGATQVSTPALVASPAPSKEFPVPPPTIPAPGQSATLDAPGPAVDTTLTCVTGAWQGTPTFSFQWYRDGTPIAGATEQEYVVAESSLSAAASFQCAVIGTNSDGTVIEVSANTPTSPPPNPPAPTATAAANFPAALMPTVTTIELAGEVFEICEAGDVCQAGRVGGAIGKFSSPRGIAVDNSPGGSGDVYVVDDENLRVQKFSSTGVPILTFGRGVNQTTGGDLCTVESGAVCGPGSVNNGQNPGQFGAWPTQGSFAELPNPVAVDDEGNVFVADVRAGGTEEGRIEKFGPSGQFLGQVRILGGSTNTASYARPMSVAVNTEDRIFTSTSAGVEMFDQSQLGLADVGPSFADQKLIDEGERPIQVSVDTHDKVWLTESNIFSRQICGIPGPQRRAILALDGNGRLLYCAEPLGAAELPDVTGLAVAPSGIAYAAVGSQNTIKTFELPEAHQPEISSQTAAAVTTRSARLQAEIDPGFEATSFTFEYGLGDCDANPCASVSGDDDVNGTNDHLAEVPIADLQPNTRYHFRVRAQNRLGEAIGVDRTFVTFPEVDLLDDPCPNALARQQTRAAGLDDCRAYELASAEFAGGYDVESDLVPGQTPFDGYPDADGKLLYAVHNGGIPGTGKPTNRGPDPYVAIRNAETERWETKYVGIPADAPSALPFSSTVAGGDAGLDTLAFGGSEICDPCFSDGSAGMPIHLPDGSLVQGMQGSISVPDPQPAGQVEKPLSGDGSHFVFGSEQQFEPAGNANSLTIYDRNLSSATTQVASTMPDGSTMTGDVAELDISEDGNRILIGRLVSTDSQGNQYFDLYMHVGTDPSSVPVAETPDGVLFGGMTGDGSKVLFTTRDQLAGDTDTSVDLFSADVGPTSATVSRVSTGTGGTGNTDACDPAPNSFNPENWNTIPGGPTDCSVAAIGGGEGVARETGAVYFLSPETLDGNGTPGAPNLFLGRPGSTPEFVATLESGANSTVPPFDHYFLHSFGSFEVANSTAIDPVTGSIYVWDVRSFAFAPGPFVAKYSASGKLDESFGAGGQIDGSSTPGGPFLSGGGGVGGELPVGVPISIAVDADPSSPSYRDLYVADLFNLDKFGPSGEYISSLPLAGEIPSSVAVNPANGQVHLAGLFGVSKIYSPTGTLITNYESPFFEALDIAVNSNGVIYRSNLSETQILNSEGTPIGTLQVGPSYGVAVDPSNNHVYVDEGNQVIEYDEAGNQVGGPIGVGTLSGSVSLSADSGRLAISNVNTVATYGPRETPTDRSYDSPLVIDSVKEASTRHLDEFQTNSSGDDAVFPTTLPLTQFDNGGKYGLYRFEAGRDEIDCVSCPPTEDASTADASLPRHGLGLTDDGRVFFDSSDPLVLRDTNEKPDAYEWKDGEPQLISTGNSTFGSGMLSTTRSGRDAFFFTRDQLVPSDVNGQAMKIYDAREEGGFFVIPERPPCAASDECHGPGTQAAPPPPIGTLKGSGGQFEPEPAKQQKCKKGFRKRKVAGKKKCVRKPHRRFRTGRGGRR